VVTGQVLRKARAYGVWVFPDRLYDAVAPELDGASDDKDANQ